MVCRVGQPGGARPTRFGRSCVDADEVAGVVGRPIRRPPATRPRQQAGQLAAIADAELRVDRSHVELDGVDRDDQLGRDLRVRAPRGHELQDLPLAGGQRLDRARQASPRAEEVPPPGQHHVAGHHLRERPDDLLGRARLEDQGVDPMIQRAAHHEGVGVVDQERDAQVVESLAELTGGDQPLHRAVVEVDEHDVGGVVGHRGDQGRRLAEAADDVEPRPSVQRGLEGLEREGVTAGERRPAGKGSAGRRPGCVAGRRSWRQRVELRLAGYT